MIDTTDYNFKLMLKKKSKREKTINNDFHMNSRTIPSLNKSNHNSNNNHHVNLTPRKLKSHRLNKSSNDLISEPKAHFDSFTSQSSLSANLPGSNSPVITIANHFGSRNPARKSSYLTNLNLVLESNSHNKSDSITSNQLDNQLPNWRSFYIKKMVEFGFNPENQLSNNFKSRSELSINSIETNISENEIKKSIKRLKSSKLNSASFTSFKGQLNSSQSKSYCDLSNQKKSATKFFSPSLIILPELDETVPNNTSFKDNNLNSSSNNSNDDNNFNTFDNLTRLNSNSILNTKMSRQMMNSANKTGRSELTLPPIVETKVNNFKKSNSSRVDSGIAVEYGNENHSGGGGGGWSNTSENGAENVITTIEIVEPNNNSLKKNATSSTLNSYGKTSSNQSKASVNNNLNSSKLSHTNNKQLKASLSPANANEANYLANVEKLNNLNVNNDDDYLQVNKKAPTNDTSKQNKQPALSRQNTITTINNNPENLPLVSRQNLNVSPTQQQQKPVPKPRTNSTVNINNNNNKRALSLQRQNTQMPNNENSQFLKENSVGTQDKKLLKRESTNLGNAKQVNNNLMPNNAGALRPKTGNANNRTVVTFNINTETEKNPKSDEQENTSKPVGLTASNLIKPNEFDIMKYNEETENVIAALNLLENDEQAMNDYTMMRIMKWLEEVENCHNMMQPPSQLAWSNNQSGADRSTQKRNSEFADIKSNFLNNEYCLSDYDSLDEQIIEYNRVVDKTYHIVHDED